MFFKKNKGEKIRSVFYRKKNQITTLQDTNLPLV